MIKIFRSKLYRIFVLNVNRYFSMRLLPTNKLFNISLMLISIMSLVTSIVNFIYQWCSVKFIFNFDETIGRPLVMQMNEPSFKHIEMSFFFPACLIGLHSIRKTIVIQIN